MKSVRRKTFVAVIALVALGVTLVAAWRFRKEAIEADARHHNNLGAAMLDESLPEGNHKSLDEAAKEFEAALRLVPGYRSARINLGIAGYYTYEGLYPDMIELQRKGAQALESLLQDDPRDPYAHFLSGQLAHFQNSDQAAAEHFEAVLREDPDDLESLFMLAWSFERAGGLQEAIIALRKVIAREPSRGGAHRMLHKALAATGREEEAKEVEASLARLEKTKVKKFYSNKYLYLYWLALKKYATPIADSRDPRERPDPPPHYRDVSREAGLAFQHAGTSARADVRSVLRGEPTPREWFQSDANRRALAAALGAGCAFADLNGDGRLDIFLANTDGRHALYEGRGEGNAGGKFADATPRLASKLLSEVGTACVAGDIDNDGLTELFIVGYGGARLYRWVGAAFADITEAFGIPKCVPESAWCATAAFGDVDHDGDLDVFIGCLVDLSQPADGRDTLRFPDDFPAQPNLLLRNNGDGTFTEIAKEAGLAEGGGHGTRAAFFTDLNDDLAVDLVTFDFEGRPAAFLSRKDGTFTSRPDVASASPWISAALARLPPLGESRAFGDFDGDGATDMLVSRNGQPAALFRNGSMPSHWLTVNLSACEGHCARRSNRAGIGARVEVRTPAFWRRKELRAGNGQGGCDAAEVTFDLAGQSEVDFVRVLFPSGARWCVHSVASNQVLTVKEPDLEKW